MKRIKKLALLTTIIIGAFSTFQAQAGNKNFDPLSSSGQQTKKQTNTSTTTTTTTTTPTLQLKTLSLDTGSWTTVYNGYGSITYDSVYGIVLEPKASTAPSETHAALTLANVIPVRNFALSVTANTTNQLRLNSPPNPWEVCWIFFNYNATATGKSTNYILLKPNGIELGTAYDELGQTFLYTAQATAAAIGVNNKFDIQKVDGRVVVSINGQKVIDYSGGGLIDVAGSIGVYTEDARVHVTSAQFAPL